MLNKLLNETKAALRPYKKQLTNWPYYLKDAASNSVISFAPAKGGQLVSWTVDGQEVFYMDKGSLKDFQKPTRGGIPILFPICGGLPNNTYSLHGKSHLMGYHGFARDLPWKLYDDSRLSSGKITFALDYNGQTLSMYPFMFQLLCTYQLKGYVLEIHQKVLNLSPEPMPFSIGMHPYFFTADKSQLQLSIPAQTYHDNLNGNDYPWQGRFDYGQDEVNVLFQNLDKPEVSVVDPQRGLKIELSFKKPYTSLLFWSVKGQDFYCIEPWSAGFNAMNTGEGICYVQPFSCVTTSLSFSVTKLNA